jgi:transposase
MCCRRTTDCNSPFGLITRIRRQLKRRYVLAFFQKLPPCLVGIEACASSHHWSREIKALGAINSTNA